MAQNKTTRNDNDVAAFIGNVADQKKRDDSFRIAGIFKKVTGYEPRMWGSSIIGFGSYHYRYKSGHEGDAPITGFSPRKDAIVLYLAYESETRNRLLEKFGKHKSGKGCVYIKRLEDIDTGIFEKLIEATVEQIRALYPAGIK